MLSSPKLRVRQLICGLSWPLHGVGGLCMKKSAVFVAFLFSAAALCIGGCGAGGGSGSALMPPPASGGGPAATPTPPGSTPTPGPSSAPANVAVYQGCNVFTAGDWYNKQVTSSSVD